MNTYPPPYCTVLKVNVTDYYSYRLQTAIYTNVKLNLIPFVFSSRASWCFFYECHHSPTVRQRAVIESLTRYYLFIFHKHLPLHSSSPSKCSAGGAPALALSKCWRHNTELGWESAAQGWAAVVISHLTVH